MTGFFKSDFNWSAMSVVIDTLGLITIWIPTIAYFIYSHINFIDCWIVEETSNGLMIAIHNKIKYSLYIKYCKIVFCNKGKISFIYDAKSILIKPDEIYRLGIDVNDISIPSKKIFLLKITVYGKKGTHYQIMKRRK